MGQYDFYEQQKLREMNAMQGLYMDPGLSGFPIANQHRLAQMNYDAARAPTEPTPNPVLLLTGEDE